MVKKQFALSIIVLLSMVVNAKKQDYIVSCDTNSLLFPKKTLSKDTKNLSISADYSEITNGNYSLTGNATINSSNYYLAADKINLQKHNQTSKATGNIKFQSKNIMLAGEKASIKKQDAKTQTVFEQVQFHYLKGKLNGQAKKITSDGNKQILDSVSYTLCPVGNTDWVMKASKMTIDPEANQGIAKNVTVELMGIPIFYFPYYEWKLKGRNSGFLAPTFSTFDDSSNGKNGYQIYIPYYFNIAPEQDFLLALNQVSTRGSVIEGKYRQLIGDGRIEIEAHYLDKDKLSKNKRWYFDTQLDLPLNDTIALNIISKRVSDKQYFKEVLHQNTATTELTSSLNLSYNNKEKNLNASIFAENQQLVGNNKNIEYTRVPEIFINKKVQGLDGREIDLSIIHSKFEHKTKNPSETGTRTHARAIFTRNTKTNVYSLQPKFEISKTEYAMDNNIDKSRSIYNFGLDAKLFFQKNTDLLGKKIIQTLTPRLAYNYTPYKNQSTLPNFDSEKMSNAYESLFSDKQYTGLDRISKMNDITFGLESNFIDQKTGETYLTLKLAQAHYLKEKNGKNYSNIATVADFTMNKFSFNNTLEYDIDTSKIAKHHSVLSYLSDAKKFITLTHGDDGEQESTGLYVAYPITQKAHVFAGINRSLTDTINNKETVGLAYESCCWAVRVARFKEITSANKFDNITKFEFIFKGLTSTDATLAERLEEDIPNYLGSLE